MLFQKTQNIRASERVSEKNVEKISESARLGVKILPPALGPSIFRSPPLLLSVLFCCFSKFPSFRSCFRITIYGVTLDVDSSRLQANKALLEAEEYIQPCRMQDQGGPAVRLTI